MKVMFATRPGLFALSMAAVCLLQACQPANDSGQRSFAAPRASAAAEPGAGLAANAKAPAIPEKAVLGFLASAAGLHALSEHCGQLKPEVRSDAVARLKSRWVGGQPGQVAGHVFESTYQSAYAETRQRISQQPEQAKQACAELPVLEQQMEKALKAMGRPPA